MSIKTDLGGLRGQARAHAEEISRRITADGLIPSVLCAYTQFRNQRVIIRAVTDADRPSKSEVFRSEPIYTGSGKPGTKGEVAARRSLEAYDYYQRREAPCVQVASIGELVSRAAADEAVL